MSKRAGAQKSPHAEHTKVVWECKRRAGGKKEMPHAEHTKVVWECKRRAGGKKEMSHAEHTKVVWECVTGARRLASLGCSDTVGTLSRTGI